MDAIIVGIAIAFMVVAIFLFGMFTQAANGEHLVSRAKYVLSTERTNDIKGVSLTLDKLKQALRAEHVYDNSRQQKVTEEIIEQIRKEYLESR